MWRSLFGKQSKHSPSRVPKMIPSHSLRTAKLKTVALPVTMLEPATFGSISKNRVRNQEKTTRLQLPSEVIPSDSDTSIPIPNEKVNGPFSLPAPSVIVQQANKHQLRQLNDYSSPIPGDGQRPHQFADQTAQDSPTMPDYVKHYLWNAYGEHFYDADTNRENAKQPVIPRTQKKSPQGMGIIQPVLKRPIHTVILKIEYPILSIMSMVHSPITQALSTDRSRALHWHKLFEFHPVLP